jgi:hypothetical protein
MDFMVGKLKHEVIKLKREAKQTLELETPLEKAIREATSNDNWNVSNTHLLELAQYSRSYEDRQKMMAKIWERLKSNPEKWHRHIKTLTLVEYLLKNGPDEILWELQNDVGTLRKQEHFRCGDEGGAKAIREKAQAVLTLMTDKDTLHGAREEAANQRARFAATSSSLGGGTRVKSSGGVTSAVAAGMKEVAATAGVPGVNEISKKSFNARFDELKKQQNERRKAEGLGMTYEERPGQPDDNGLQSPGADRDRDARDESDRNRGDDSSDDERRPRARDVDRSASSKSLGEIRIAPPSGRKVEGSLEASKADADMLSFDDGPRVEPAGKGTSEPFLDMFSSSPAPVAPPAGIDLFDPEPSSTAPAPVDNLLGSDPWVPAQTLAQDDFMFNPNPPAPQRTSTGFDDFDGFMAGGAGGGAAQAINAGLMPPAVASVPVTLPPPTPVVSVSTPVPESGFQAGFPALAAPRVSSSALSAPPPPSSSVQGRSVDSAMSELVDLNLS